MKRTFLFSIALCTSYAWCNDHTNALHGYLWANYYQFDGNAKEANERYRDIINGSNSIYTQKGYILFLHANGNHAAVAELAHKTGDRFANDPEVQLIIALSLKKAGKNNEADNKLIELSQKFKEHAEIAFHTAEVYMQRKELQNALTVVDNFLNSAVKKPNSFIFIFLRAQLYAQLGRLNDALEQIKLCIEKQPRFDKAWLLFALIQEQMGKIGDAINGYASYLELSPDSNQQIKQHLVELALKQKALENNNQVIHVNASCFERCLMLFKEERYKEALGLIEKCIGENDIPQHRLMKVQILVSMKEFDAAINQLIAWILKNPQEGTWLQTLYILHNTGIPLPKIVNAFEKISGAQPNNSFIVLYLADLYTRAGDQKKALSSYEALLKLTKEPELLTKIYYQIAIIKYDAKAYDEMALILGKARSIQSHFAPANNLLAYYYATKGKNVEHAQELISLALQTSPNNPHFLDTQALIWYKQGAYEKALKTFQSVAQRIPHDATVHIHIAKTHTKLAQKDHALTAIKHAALHARTQYEKETSNKLAQRWDAKK